MFVVFLLRCFEIEWEEKEQEKKYINLHSYVVIYYVH